MSHGSSDSEGATAHVDRVERGLAWREAGVGAGSEHAVPVVFLHGLGGTRSSWGPQLRGLSGQFHCIAWDMPGYGESELLEPLTYAGIAGRLVDLIDLLGFERVDLVGLSFGGMQALHAALEHPARVRRMVLADTSPAFGMDGTTKQEWTAMRLAPLDAGGEPSDQAEFILDMITATPLVGRIRDEAVESFGQISVEGFRAAVTCLPDNDVRNELHRIGHEVLVVVGALDEETPPSYAAALHSGLTNSRLEVIDGVGHLSPAEAPDRFNELVQRFLAT